MVSPGPPGGWDFSLDDHIGDEVLSRLHSPVHFSRFFSRRPFILVVDFPRSSFRLCSSSAALALRACIGGSPGDLHVIVSYCVQRKLGFGFTPSNLSPAKIMKLSFSFGETVIQIGAKSGVNAGSSSISISKSNFKGVIDAGSSDKSKDMGENSNNEAHEEQSHNISVVSQQYLGDWQIILVLQSHAPIVSIPGRSIVNKVQDVSGTILSLLVYPQFWKLLSIYRFVLGGPRLNAASGCILLVDPLSIKCRMFVLGGPRLNAASGCILGQTNALAHYQLAVHQMVQFALLASSLIWAKDNWTAQ
uniref:Uncharacterized protein n=1 Tax=Oryza rufipogon TaxID=4529 RepID=A0A0E0R7M7_ORYRU